MGLQVALRNRPRACDLEPVLSDALGTVVFGSDQGMCGQFNGTLPPAADDIGQVGVEGGERAIWRRRTMVRTRPRG